MKLKAVDVMAAEVKRKDSRQGEQEALGDSAATPASPHGICHMHVVISISRGSTRRALLASAWLATDCVHLPRGTRAMHLTRFHALRRFTAAIGWDSGCAALGVMGRMEEASFFTCSESLLLTSRGSACAPLFAGSTGTAVESADDSSEGSWQRPL